MNLERAQAIRNFNSAVLLAALTVAGGIWDKAALAELVVEGQTPASHAVMTADTATDGANSGANVAGNSQAAEPVQVVAVKPQQVIVPAQAYPVQPIVVAAPQVAPQAPAADAGAERTTRTELVRRERMREELRNEDMLQERLEELRLQDEKRRTNQVLGVAVDAVPGQQLPLLANGAPAQPVAVQTAVTEQVVSVPVTDRLGASQASAVSAAQLSDAASVSGDEPATLRLTPRGGLSTFSTAAAQNPYLLQSRYTVGAGVDVGVSDHLTFELGYSFSEYGVALNSATALGLTPILGAGGYGFSYDSNSSTGALKQNVVDAGLKVHLLGRQSKLRPFIGGGASYARSYLNYDARIVDYLQKIGFGGFSPDYDLTQFLANASAGMELQLSKSVVVGLTYKYYTVLSARQNQDLYNPALYGAYPAAAYAYGPYAGAASLAQLDKQYVGGSLSNASFYSIMGTIGFSF